MTPVNSSEYLLRVRELYLARDVEFHLHPPAAETDLAGIDETFGVNLPEWLTALWREANGGHEYSPVFTRPNFLTGLDFLSVGESLDLRTRLNGLSSAYSDYDEPRVRDSHIIPKWFPLSWVPFAAFAGSTTVLFADCSPGPGGNVGQVIAFVHDPDQISLVAQDGESYLDASLAWLTDQAEEFVLEE